jgi:hypothetical protein
VLGSREIKSKEVEKSNKKKSKQIARNNVSQYPIGICQLFSAILEPLQRSLVCRLGYQDSNEMKPILERTKAVKNPSIVKNPIKNPPSS